MNGSIFPPKKKETVVLEIKKILQDFLDRRAISQEQYDKSFGDMMLKMCFDADGNSTK